MPWDFLAAKVKLIHAARLYGEILDI